MSATIRTSFGRKLERRIEKVITYQNRGDEQLKNEIGEYVVTDHIEQNFDKLLKLMQTSMKGGDGHEIGVWVSGFYGSGKSSFTKYLGFALDRQMKVGDEAFLELLKNQVRSTPVKALFNQVSGSYDAVVIFLDLASEMLAGASMTDISTVLYLKTLQWAGYSEDLKVAELERMLEKDGKLEAFKKRAGEELNGTQWSEVQNQPLIANTIAKTLASEFYPNLFKTPEDFAELTVHRNLSELKRAEEMVDLIRRKSGKENILFIIDEVGQYVASRDNLILNLDGLAKNLKQIGKGRVWLFSTAQQTLTEDNPGAVINAAGLYKLKDRFPIQIHLEASDIREICNKRLLSKSADGEKALGAMFDSHGASLRTITQLKDAGVYEAALEKRLFIDLYPFLPAHFEILLQLLGRLARRTGGVGLRSAIKVVQDVLTERNGPGGSGVALADAELGTLANTVTLYDALRRDIQSSFEHIVGGVARVEERFPNKPLHQAIAKSIAVMQVLENLPVTVNNIAALLQERVDAPGHKDAVTAAVDELLKDSMVPLGEKNGSLRFLTQAAITLQKEFDQIEYKNADVRKELSDALRNIFTPLPQVRLNSARPVTTGIKLSSGSGQAMSLAGDREPVQFHIAFVQPAAYDQEVLARKTDSMSRQERATVFVVARTDSDAEQLAVTLVRCQRFLDSYRSTNDPETQEFVKVVAERKDRSGRELMAKLEVALKGGSFLFQGEQRPVSEFSLDLREASKAFLSTVAARVFDRYSEAAAQVESNVAERFLKTPLDRATTAEDPLQLITRQGGAPRIKTDFKALQSIRDYIDQQGSVEGRRLLEAFGEPPFGWSKDTTRYLLAALLLGSEIKLRIAGKDHAVKNDDTLKVLSSSTALGPVGISLRQERPDPEVLLRAADRMRDLTGDTVMPLEDEVAGKAKRHFPAYQTAYATLATELRGMELPGAQRMDDLCSDLAEVVSGDGSDAIKRLGGQESTLFDALIWSKDLKQSFANGLKETLTELRELRNQIGTLPNTSVFTALRTKADALLAEAKELLDRERYFEHTPDLNKVLKQLNAVVNEAVQALAAAQEELRTGDLDKWQRAAAWSELLEEDKEWVNAEVGKLAVEPGKGLPGLQQLMTHEIELNSALRSVDQWITTQAANRKLERIKRAQEKGKGEKPEDQKVVEEEMLVPPSLERIEDITQMIDQLIRVRTEMEGGKNVRFTLKIAENAAQAAARKA